MGRGLSDLQRWILAEARKQDRLYYADICEKYYGWRRKYHTWGDPFSVGCNKFYRSEIGHREYNRVMATISRSCRRLEKRGLVRCISGMYSRWAAVVAVRQSGRKEATDE